MRKKKGFLPGCLGVLWALLSLACGGGALTGSGPAVNRNALAPEDIILVYARSGETSPLAVYAVKRGEAKPALWSSIGTDDMTAVTAVSHAYMGHRQFPYYDKTPFYYGANGLHVAVPRPDFVPLPDRLRPPEPENSRLEVVALRQSPDGRYLAYTVRPRATGPRQLFLLDGATGEIRLLREDGLRAEAVRWSDDGRYLFANMGARLARWERETESWIDLDWSSDFVESSPDRQYLLWYDSAKQVYSLSDAAGESRFLLLAEGDVNTVHRAWSPDGRYLAFQSADAGTASIHIADLPQQTVTELYKVFTSTQAASGFTMSWSPDSQQIAFLGLGKCKTTIGADVLATGSQTACHRDVYIVPINGGGAQRVTNTDDGKIVIEPEYTIGWLKRDQ
ncbi:MAG: PD40 domain-containing protein [Anaerolineae bacterium]|nr:PD40 domain-containing protein [Anaerolineae bacterium]